MLPGWERGSSCLIGSIARVTERLDLSAMRVGYNAAGETPDRSGDLAPRRVGPLEADWLAGDPPWLGLFTDWLADAVAAQAPEPNAFVLGTVDEHGHPATRTVLCKEADARGVVFYTGYASGKGRDLAATPHAAATFPWIALGRQVHIRGRVEKVTADETRIYWASRPRGSQLSARASQQSEPIGSRAELVARAQAVAAEFADESAPVPVPDHWGGYRIVPDLVEFWQGAADRLHNRIRLTRDGDSWRATRLQP